MAILSIPDQAIQLFDSSEIKAFLQQYHVFFDQWSCTVTFDDTASQDEILEAYAKDLKPFMSSGGYQSADVISIHALTPNYEQLRAKFLAEHIHDEDEIRLMCCVSVAISLVCQRAPNIGLMQVRNNHS